MRVLRFIRWKEIETVQREVCNVCGIWLIENEIDTCERCIDNDTMTDEEYWSKYGKANGPYTDF